MNDPMEDEFGVVPGWTADAVEELGADHALPAGCRGSGTPAALRWLCERMGLREGMSLLDSGAGIGGPAALAAQEYGVGPHLVEPMLGACRAARRLFPYPVTASSGEQLPFADAVFDAAWSIAVLCTLEDKPPVLAELRRVVRRDAPVGLLVFVRTVDRLPEQPEGNDFPDLATVVRLLEGASLTVVDQAALADFPQPHQAWERRGDRVDEVVERDHGDDPSFVSSGDQARTMGRLIGRGLVEGRLLVARATTGASGDPTNGQ